jgi:hypothetical protein
MAKAKTKTAAVRLQVGPLDRHVARVDIYQPHQLVAAVVVACEIAEELGYAPHQTKVIITFPGIGRDH